MTWPRVTVPGRGPDRFTAFTQIGPERPVIRVRFRDISEGARWRCDQHGDGRDVLCLDSFAALGLTSASHNRWQATQAKPMPNTVLAGQLKLFEELRRSGHSGDQAGEIVQRVRPSALFGRDGHLDADAIRACAAAHPVMAEAAGTAR